MRHWTFPLPCERPRVAHTQRNDGLRTWALWDSPALRGHQPGRRVTALSAVGGRKPVGGAAHLNVGQVQKNTARKVKTAACSGRVP